MKALEQSSPDTTGKRDDTQIHEAFQTFLTADRLAQLIEYHLISCE